MKQKNKKYRFLAGDFWVIALILCLAGGITAHYLLQPAQTIFCEIQQNGVVQQRIQLADGYTDTLTITDEDGHSNTIAIDGKQVRISQANCPDQVCVQSGWLKYAGQSAVCLPHRLIVRLVGTQQTNTQIDAWVQ